MFSEKPGGFLHDLKAEAAEVSAELRHSFGMPRFLRRRHRKVNSTAGDQYHVIREEVHVISVAVYSYTQETLQRINQTEIEPLRDAVAEEIHNLMEEAGRSPDIMAVRDFAKSTASQISSAAGNIRRAGKNPARRPGQLNAISMRSLGRALKQARDLVFSEDNRGSQVAAMQGAAAGSARAQILQAEKSVDSYLKVSAASVAAATLGTLFFPPLKLVSGGIILYAAWPAFKGAAADIFQRRKITVRHLDSVSLLGLIAGGYFLICSLTVTIFHASAKMMLKTEDRSRRLLADMFGEQPSTVWVIVDGGEIEIPFERLEAGATLVIRAGQMIPIDGVVTAGNAAVDQHILTGEAQPAEKQAGDKVFAATVVLAGRIEVGVEKTGAETAAAQIRDVLANTTDFRNAIQVRWRDVADKSVLPTLGLAGLGLVFLGPVSALAVVNSNYVAVMKVASPLAMLNFLQRASLAGILIKDGRALEAVSKIDTVVFDKTGTLTENQPRVGEIFTWGSAGADELLTYAAAVEARQSHPIAAAIVLAAKQRNLAILDLESARYEMGYGIQARSNGRLIRVGSARYMAMEGIPVPPDFETRRVQLQEHGASVVFVAFNDEMAGAIELRPTLRPEAKQVIEELKARGLTVYIISGDHEAPTRALAAELGVDHFLAEVLPQDKSAKVEFLQKEGRRVCFVGDGINDAIALKTANVSVSLRGASTLATDTAQVILMDESLRQLAQLFEIGIEYNANLKTLMSTTFGPGLISLASVFLLGAGNGTALGLFNLSMIAGLVNGILPALRQQDEIAAQQRHAALPEPEKEAGVSAAAV
ncbi:MAG TPA: heavy metal translocating P-type ATPase [Bryobacteraceae bacterium]|jgi:Cu2+-exporting ATPase|nr:heavy metal translocating P-type ATPase [Bryobacteraceae bacterium]